MVLAFWQGRIFLRLEVFRVKDDVQLCNLFDAIIESIQNSAKDFVRFMNGEGSIRITYLPQSEFGRKLQQNFSKNARRCEIVAPIAENGNLVLNRSTDPIDSSALTAMQVASYLHKQENHVDGDKPLDEKHGFAPDATALSFQLLYDHALFGLVLVSVYGATSLENKLVANDVAEVVRAWCKMGPEKDGRARLTFIAN